jgi:hypothetical protein
LITCVLLLACGQSKQATTDTGSDVADAPSVTPSAPKEPTPPTNPTPYEYEGDATEAEYDQAALEDALEVLLGTLLTLTGEPPLIAYQTMLESADDNCPIWYENEGNVYWAGGCTSESGTTFDGYMFTENYIDAALMGEDSAMTGSIINGQSFMTNIDGGRLDLAGYSYAASGTISDGQGWMTGAIGSFSWTDAAATDTWMGGPIEPNLELVAYKWTHDQEYRGIIATGGVNGFGQGWSSAYLDNVMVLDDLGGYWPCPQETNGIVSIRNPDGHWFQVVFDIESAGDGYTMAPGTCDGCGTVFLNGEVVGEACTDFRTLLDWEDQPW